MRLALPLVAFSLVALAAYAPHPAPRAFEGAPADSTQWENLHVLPDSLSRDQLIGIMRGFGDALGVRCGHCHVREGEDFDFASDENPHKEVARGMMRMTWQINREILPAIDGLHGEGEALRVTCYTCHRGAAVPDTAAEAEEAGHEHGDH